MAGRPTVLVYEDGSGGSERLAPRVRELGFRAVVAKTPDVAEAAVADPRFGVVAALLPAALPVVDLGGWLEVLRTRACAGRLEAIAAGRPPGGEALSRLRAAGIERVLWEPFSDAALRFQLNRGLEAGDVRRTLRRVERVPVPCRVRVLRASAVTPAALYTLSVGGAFVETPRPAPTRASLSLELLLREGDVPLRAEVLYTNVPGNLRRESLPTGMGVRFVGLGAGAERAIEQCVRQEAARLVLTPPHASRGRGWVRRLWWRGSRP